eukprot:jgi/Galph1/2231/GphlegSOOS_G870.1
MSRIPTAIDGAIGGLSIGLGVAVNAVMLGRVTGISGIVGGMFQLDSGWSWRAAFLTGFTIGAQILRRAFPEVLSDKVNIISPWKLVVGGLMIGFGTRLGSGCTSGHGLCGIGRGSRRSVMNTIIAFSSAALVNFATESYSIALSDSGAVQNIFAVNFDAMRTFFSALKPVFMGLIGVIFVSVKGLGRNQPVVNKILPPIVGAYAGYLFSIGLGYSGMTLPQKILSFLSFRSEIWDPSLMFVFGSGLLLSAASFYLLKQERYKPILHAENYIPTRSDIDWRLVVGGILFGSGWGMVGLCPGPALVNFLGRPELKGNQLLISSLMGGMILFMLMDNYILNPEKSRKTEKPSERHDEHKKAEQRAEQSVDG